MTTTEETQPPKLTNSIIEQNLLEYRAWLRETIIDMYPEYEHLVPVVTPSILRE